MKAAELMALCLNKPGAYEDHPFGDTPICYKVKGKIFAQLYPEKITLKCTAFSGEALRAAYPGIVTRGYHCPAMQQPYWNTIDLSRFPEEELPFWIDHAYEAAVSSLPKRVQKELFPPQPEVAP